MLQELHAPFSPSQLPRLIRCPGSFRLTKDLTDQPSEYAQEGTMLHKVTEICLENQHASVPAALKNQYSLDEDQVDAVESILTWVSGLRAKYENDGYFESIEVKTSLAGFFEPGNFNKTPNSHVLEDVWGTLDYCLRIPSIGTIICADWKFGKGIEVWPDTEQLSAYALGAIKNPRELDTYSTIIVAIGQPRIYSEEKFKEVTHTSKGLLLWLRETLVPALESAISRNPKIAASNKACQWCKVKASCSERHKQSNITATRVFDAYKKLPGLVSNEELSSLLERFKDLKAHMKDLENHARATLLQGKEFPGWKLVTGRSNRTWAHSDESSLITWLESQGVETSECYKEPAFKSVAQVEKAIGRQISRTKEFKAYVNKPLGKPTMAKESDRREALKFSGPQSAFKDHIL